MKRFLRLAAGLSIFLAGPAVRADGWDEGGDPDNACGGTSDNDLIHGSDQVHDLGALPGPAIDQDFYTFQAVAFASYEAVVDGTTGDLNNGGAPDFQFERVNNSCASVQTFESIGFGFSKSLRFEAGNGFFGALRVGSAACGTGCTAADQYHIRFYETTYTVPRFNNAGSQTTVLIVQNPTPSPVTITPRFFDSTGALVGSATLILAPRETRALNTATVAGVAGQSGSIIISNTARYGDLSGKAVAVEPSTGFTFDTAMVPKPH
jgi:hypothetical protein